MLGNHSTTSLICAGRAGSGRVHSIDKDTKVLVSRKASAVFVVAQLIAGKRITTRELAETTMATNVVVVNPSSRNSTWTDTERSVSSFEELVFNF